LPHVDKALLRKDLEKVLRAHRAFRSSVDHLPVFHSEMLENPVAMEPFDALAGRFERLIEVVAMKALRTLELYEMGASSPTLRDRLAYAAKRGWVSDVELWFEMREYRNKIAHDYLPEQIDIIYLAITGRFLIEIDETVRRLSDAMQAEWS